MKNQACAILGQLKKYAHLIVFAVFLVFQSVGIFSVSMTGDDYYYAGFLKNGAEYFFSENIFHYMETNGRAFIHLLDEIFLAMPLLVWKVFELFLVGALVFLVAKVFSADDKNKFPVSLISTCVLFSVIDLYVLRETVLWITGSFNYVLPVVLVFVLYAVFSKSASREKGAWYLPVLAFFAALTTEQSAMAAVLICMFIFAKTAFVENKKLCLSHYFTLPASLLAFGILFLSPGNDARQAYYPEFYAKPLFERLTDNLASYFRGATETQGMLIFFVLLFVAAGLSALAKIVFRIKSRSENDFAVGRFVFDIFLMVFPLVTAVSLVLYSSVFPELEIRTAYTALMTLISSLLILASFTIDLMEKKDDGLALIMGICAIVSFGAMIFGPVYGPRVFFAPIIFMLPPILKLAREACELKFCRALLPLLISCHAAYLLSSRFIAPIVVVYFIFLLELGISKLKKYRPSAVIALGASFFVALSVGFGYVKNIDSNWYNRHAAEIFAREGKTEETLVLSLPEDELYIHSPLNRSRYHEVMMKKYYGIDTDVKVEYVPPEGVGLK